MHATEVLGAAQLIETSFQMVSRTDPETMRFLNDVIILFVHANPDGMELVSNWYMRETDEKKRSTGGIPRLYQKYIGHDNNRDFYMGAQAETQNMLRIQYQEWFPQIVYNHHQTGPAGAVLFAPPFRAPHNHHFDPLVIYGVDLVGTSMHTRYALEGKPGAVRRDQAGYQTWWNGGLRTTVYFHNMVGLLTETIGNPTPMQIPFTPEKLIPQENYVYPITPQTWHFRSSVDYSVTGNRAVFDVASRHREQFLYNIYKMGRNAIEKGSRDTWTDYPRRIAAVQELIQKDRAAVAEGNARLAAMGGFSGVQPTKYFDELRKPEMRDPRGFIMPSTQADFLTATHFVNALRKGGRRRASRDGSFQRRGQVISVGFVRGQDSAGVPRSHYGHVRAAGLPERPAVSGWAAQGAVRQRRLYAGLPDGCSIRSHPRRIRMSLRKDSGHGRIA